MFALCGLRVHVLRDTASPRSPATAPPFPPPAKEPRNHRALLRSTHAVLSHTHTPSGALFLRPPHRACQQFAEQIHGAAVARAVAGGVHKTDTSTTVWLVPARSLICCVLLLAASLPRSRTAAVRACLCFVCTRLCRALARVRSRARADFMRSLRAQ